MSNEIKVNFKNLTEEERKILMRLIEKSNKQKSELWKPEERDVYYFIHNTSGNIEVGHWSNHKFDVWRFNVGNVFKTMKEAEFAREKRKVFVELKRYAAEHNVEEIDWNDDNKRKFRIIYDYAENKLTTATSRVTRGMGEIYFTSVQIAQDAINAVGEDKIKKYLFGVEVEESEKY